LEKIPSILRSLGPVLGRCDRSAELAELSARVLEKLRLVSSLPEDARPSVYLARGADGLLAVRSGGPLSEAIEAAGGRNVTPVGAGPFAKLTPSELAALDPDVVILQDPVAAEGPVPRALASKAIVLVDRGGPFGSMEESPSINRLVGALALASILHPDLVPADTSFMRALREGLFGTLPEPASIMPLERVR
jgi:iron complex transport system substrate-binding protein